MPTADYPHCNCAAATSEYSDPATVLLMKNNINQNTIVRLPSNLWTEAGLTNDSEGVIHYIIYTTARKCLHLFL